MITCNGDASALRLFLMRENFADNHGVTYLFASVGGNFLIPNGAEGFSTFILSLFLDPWIPCLPLGISDLIHWNNKYPKFGHI